MPFTKKRNLARIPSVYGSGSRNRNQSGWQSKAYNSVLGPYSFNFAADMFVEFIFTANWVL